MTVQRKDGFFPGEAAIVEKSPHRSVYRMDFPDGYGTMTSYHIMPGLTLIFNDFHTACGFPEQARCPGLIEINHCQSGRFECTMKDGRILWLGPLDFAVSDMNRPPSASRFTLGLYQGISLVLEPKTAWISLTAMLGEDFPCLPNLFAELLNPQSCLLIRSEPKIQHIFSELYCAPSEGQLTYFKLKSAELILFLHERQKEMHRSGACYYGQELKLRVYEMGERMTADLRGRVTIAELAKEYQVGESTIKKYFRQLYGEPPYAYLKRRRMEEAAFLLTTTKQSVTQIALAVGYQNTSKFSAAFRDIYSMTPTRYKKMILSEQNAQTE